MAVNVIEAPRPTRNLWVQSYLPEMGRGLAITAGQFFKNLFTRKDIVTVQYPEEKRDYPARYRGLHRLNYREDGTIRCVACMLCATACPANCIHIEADEREDPKIEKYPVVFVIDELRCIMCGLCVEACPCDAIRMDTGIHVHPFLERDKAFFNEQYLVNLGIPSIARQGGPLAGSVGGPQSRDH